MSGPIQLPPGLPAQTENILRDFVASARHALGDNLRSAVLFGSAAEGRLRRDSDINLILVLRDFSPSQAAQLNPALSLARAAAALQTMFLVEAEIPAAFQCFAQKFADIQRRHFTLCGPDPFAECRVRREDEILRTRQVLLNLAMRLRERYTLLASHPDQLASAIADTVGPLRTCAAAISEIENTPAASPKHAFAAIVAALGVPEWHYLPDYFSALREQGLPPSPAPAGVVAHLLALATALRRRLESLQ
ncbi:MAG: nucleotidyltransferase domain-containing protein [Bryobacterales bacterium]|nr:nucleotidyltransferase domain-containing protein [Bryobacterales bacterium]